MDENKRSKSLIIGAMGQVGSQLMSELGLGRSLPTSRLRHKHKWISLDLAAVKSSLDVNRFLKNIPVETVYCVGGMTNVELCESQQKLAMQINCKGPSEIAKVCRQQEIRFVYFSTEYVFDGLNGPYTEDDVASPISAYGKSKLAGEIEVISNNPDAIVIRTTVVYGPDPASKNFLASLRRSLQSGKNILVSCDQISTPTYNLDLAKAAIVLVKNKVAGITNVAGPERMSRFQLSVRAATFWGLDPNRIKGLPTAQMGQLACRPLAAGLDISKLQKQHPELTMRSLEEALGNWTSSL